MTEPTPEPRPFVAYPPIESFPREKADRPNDCRRVTLDGTRDALTIDAGLFEKGMRSVGRYLAFPRLRRGRP